MSKYDLKQYVEIMLSQNYSEENRRLLERLDCLDEDEYTDEQIRRKLESIVEDVASGECTLETMRLFNRLSMMLDPDAYLSPSNPFRTDAEAFLFMEPDHGKA